MKRGSKSINLPEELIDNGTKIVQALENSKHLHRTRGLNITQLAKETSVVSTLKCRIIFSICSM